jgi:hypothetical protein
MSSDDEHECWVERDLEGGGRGIFKSNISELGKGKG